MHIEINAECRRGLRIIEEIPDIKPGKLEGYNGIGKTSAIRLLQLCTGEQPFRGKEAAWRSFRDQLVRARVHITKLREARDIEWILEPSTWPVRASEYPGSSPGTITIDGRQATIADIKPLLKVHHLNTTETPVDILTRQVASAGSTLENWYRAEGESRGIAIDTAFGKVLGLLVKSSPAKIRLVQEVAREANRAVAEVAYRVEEARSRARTLSQAVDVADQLDTVRGSSPQMKQRLRELEETLTALDARRETLNQEIGEAQVQKRLSGQAEEELARLEKLVSRHNISLRKRIAELEQAAAAAHVAPSADKVSEAISSVERRLSELIDAEPIVSKGPQMFAILSDLVRRLDDAISVGLGDHILIEESGSYPAWSVHGLREAFRVQIERLAEHARTSDAEELARKIAAARSRLDSLSVAEDALDAASRAETRFRNAEEKLLEVAANFSGSADDRLNELIRLRNELDKEGRELQSQIDRRRAEIELLGGGRTEVALAAEFDRLCRVVDVDPARVRSAFEREREQFDTLTKDEAMVQARQASAEHDMHEMLVMATEVVQELSSSEDLAWLRNAIPTIAHLEDLSLEEQLTELESLERLLSGQRQSASGTIQAVRAIGVALEKLANGLREATTSGEHERQAWGRSGETEARTWDLSVQQWLANEAQQWLDDEVMRQALFAGGQEILVDPEELTVSWKLNGESFTRPLALFSSGEQAFAFTRARVAQLDRSADQYPNRVIALDEFGAYLDAERLASLSEYLVKRQKRIPNDHVLVILPCGVREQDLLAKVEKNTPREAQLSRRGYFTEPLLA